MGGCQNVHYTKTTGVFRVILVYDAFPFQSSFLPHVGKNILYQLIFSFSSNNLLYILRCQ